MKKQSYIAVVAARSGGHILPGLTLANQYTATMPATEILFFATRNALDEKIIREQNVPVCLINLKLDTVPTRYYQWPLFVFYLMGAICTSFYYCLVYRPKKIIAMGGYISLPVVIVAWLLRIPRDLYELNAVPGKATKLLAPLATSIYVCFEEAYRFFPRVKTKKIPYPIRFAHKHQVYHSGTAGKKTILILGGSQGARGLNSALRASIDSDPIVWQQYTIVHQTGAHDVEIMRQWYARHGIEAVVFDYDARIERFYEQADLIIGRAGAGTIFEAIWFSVPTVLVPLEIPGNDHQVHNANAIVREHPSTFRTIRQKTLEAKPHILQEQIQEIL